MKYRVHCFLNLEKKEAKTENNLINEFNKLIHDKIKNLWFFSAARDPKKDQNTLYNDLYRELSIWISEIKSELGCEDAEIIIFIQADLDEIDANQRRIKNDCIQTATKVINDFFEKIKKDQKEIKDPDYNHTIFALYRPGKKIEDIFHKPLIQKTGQSAQLLTNHKSDANWFQKNSGYKDPKKDPQILIKFLEKCLKKLKNYPYANFFRCCLEWRKKQLKEETNKNKKIKP